MREKSIDVPKYLYSRSHRALSKSNPDSLLKTLKIVECEPKGIENPRHWSFKKLFKQRKLLMLVEFLPILDIKELTKICSLCSEIRDIVVPESDQNSQFRNWLKSQNFDTDLVAHVLAQTTAVKKGRQKVQEQSVLTVTDLIEAQTKQTSFNLLRRCPYDKSDTENFWDDKNVGGNIIDKISPGIKLGNKVKENII